MPRLKHFRWVSRISVLPGVLLSVIFISSLGYQARGQSASPIVNLRDTPLGRSRTPQAVLNGTATLLGPLSSSTTLHLVLGLTPPKMAEEEQFLQDLQDPKSPNFHKYLTADQWNARFAPSAEDEQPVVDWAQSNGLSVTRRFANRLIIDLDGSSENVEKALAVKMNNYQLAGVTEFSNDRDPVIPSHLVNILHSISGLNSIQRLHTSRGGSADPKNGAYAVGAVAHSAAQAEGDPQALDQAMKAAQEAKGSQSRTLKGVTPEAGPGPAVTSGYDDPTDIYSSYGYDFLPLQHLGHCCNPTNYGPGSPPATSIAIATAGALNGNDVKGFQSRYTYLAYDYSTINVDGNYTCDNSQHPDDACVETTLDTEWAIATSNSFGSPQKTSHIYIYQAANGSVGAFTDMFNTILNDGNARVMSTSWGCGEFDCYLSGAMDTDHAIFNSMIGQGWTMLADSGDQGATAGCIDSDRVNYPASDPDITAVGGTSLALYTDGTFNFESAWPGSTDANSCVNNRGGSGGGCSGMFAAPGYQGGKFQAAPVCGASSRSVPDIALNAGYGQNTYFDGGWHAYGGTSIATPEAAGFMAQENSYLLALGQGVLGQVNYPLYYLGSHPSFPKHFPFYDMTAGCNNNDATEHYGIGYFCAAPGYDRITGWGSFNALQLAWGINTYLVGDFDGPVITFSGPAGVSPDKNTWFNTYQTVSWTVTDIGLGNTKPTGVAGFSASWDLNFSDPASESTHGTGNSFYAGPQYPNATSGSLQLESAGQGCHAAVVDAWDNSGFSSGNRSFANICYDITPPVTTAGLTFTGYEEVTLFATDPLSGVATTVYQLDGGANTTYAGPFKVTTAGNHRVVFYSIDVAGNTELAKSTTFTINSGAAVMLTSSRNPAAKGSTVEFTAKLGGKPSGSVQFFDGTKLIGTEKISSGKAIFKTSKLTLGSHSITAYYANGKVTSSPVIEVIENTSSTKLASSKNPATMGSSVSFTAAVSSSAGTPTGNVEFKDGSKVLGTVAISSGKAVFKTSSLSVATHDITAIYQGDTTHYQSTSSELKEVIKK